ncbi:hypothetical protein GCM10022268_23090 [Sphingomonas cynarae]|uniref:Type VI secretion system-associated protein TagF n=1 Tax=Sphingomonas cynarae TaxID=930197 RepID=A0ABP7E5L7_9SPHN
MTSAPTPIVGIVGKLPAHGDFVRRGGPGAVLTRIDDWLDGELGGAVAAGTPLDAAVAALDGWRFAVASAEGLVIAVAVASGDGVGRIFPVVATVTSAAAGREAAETWCAAAADALVAVRDAGQGADAALAALAAVAAIDPPGDAAAPATGWWHPGADAPAGDDARLPVGDAFRALLSGRTG